MKPQCPPCASAPGVSSTFRTGAVKSPVCRPCAATAAREYRARRKANGTPPPTPRLRVCKRCKVEQFFPSPVWTASVSLCKPCINEYARERSKGKELPPLPDFPLHNMPSLKCRLCGRHKAHRPDNFPSRSAPDVCKSCQTKRQRESRKRLREREAFIECRECKESVWHPQGGRGWQNNRCPSCCRQAENERYHERIKTDATKWARRQEMARAAYLRLRDGKDTSKPPTPANPPVVATEPIHEDADAIERAAVAARVRAKLAAKGLRPLDGRVVVSRG